MTTFEARALLAASILNARLDCCTLYEGEEREVFLAQAVREAAQALDGMSIEDILAGREQDAA